MLTTLTLACASTTGGGGGLDLPVWMTTPPSSPGTYFGTGTAESRSFSIARSQSTQDARANIAGQFVAQVRLMVENYEAEVGGLDPIIRGTFEAMSQTLLDQELTGVRVVEYHNSQNTQGVYVVHSLVSMDTETIAEDMDQQIREDEALEAMWMRDNFRDSFLEGMKSLTNPGPGPGL